MKKTVFISIIAILLFIGIDVNAEASWPKTFTHNGYEYSIEGIDLRIYETVTTRENNENGSSSSTEPANIVNFLNGIPEKTISLDANEYTINPTYREDKYFESRATYIDLGIDITTEKLKSLLSTEIGNTNSERGYYVELVVKHKINNYPSNYQNVYNIDTFRDLFVGNTTSREPTDTTQVLTQVFNSASIDYNISDNKVVFEYYDTVTNDNGAGLSLTNFLGFSENTYNGQLTSINHAIVFHNMKNIDVFINEMEDNNTTIEDEVINEVTNEEDNKNVIKLTPGNQEVKVPNTSKMLPIYLYLFGTAITITGFSIILYTIYKNQIQKRQESE